MKIRLVMVVGQQDLNSFCSNNTSYGASKRVKKLCLGLLATFGLLISLNSAQAAIVSGTIWNDINSDTYFGLGSGGSLGDNVLDQSDGSQTGDLGSNTYGDPVVPDAGVESGFEGIALCVTGTSVCATTAADGSYSIDVPAGGTITVTAPSGYKFSSDDPAGDNQADQQATAPTPPDLWTGTLPDTGGDAGLAPSPAIVVGFFDTNGNSADGVDGVITGSADWNTLGNCQTSAPYEDPTDANLNLDTAITDPGDDCHQYDNIVRTNDTVQIVPTIKLDNAPDGGIDNVVLEMQIFPKNGAVLTIDSPQANGLPVGCETGAAYDPQSEVITNSDGSLIVICNIGTVENGQEFRTISIKPTGDSPNGSSFTTEFKAYAAGNDAVPSEEPEVPEIQISSLPRFDLTKNSYNPAAGSDGGSPRNTYGVYPGRSELNPATGVVEQGVRMRHQISIMVDDGFGSSSLGDSFSFEEFIDPRYAAFGAHLEECTPNMTSSWDAPDNGSGAFPYLDNSTIDNGIYTCATDGSSNLITITNADTSGAHYPSEGADGTSTSPHKIVVTGTLSVWYPYSAFYRFAGPDQMLGTADDGTVLDPNDPSLWQYGDDAVLGTYSQTNCIGNFDPGTTDALGNPVSNYGTDFEPGYVSATEADGNNCRNTSFTVSQEGNFSKRYAGAWYLDGSGHLTDKHRFYDAPNYHWACTGEPDTLIVPGQAACESGDGPIVGTQLFTASLIFHARSSAVDLAMPTLCEVIDNSTYTLEPIPAGTTPAIPSQIVGEYAYYNYDDTSLPAIDGGTTALNEEFGSDHGFYIEYARFNPLNTTQRTWQIDHAAGTANAVDGSIPVSNPQQQLAAKDCGNSLTASGELEWSLDPDADGWDIGDVVIVRMLSEDGVVIQAGDYSTNLHLHFAARDTFYSPTTAEDGLDIPLGTLLPNVSNYGWDRDGDGDIDYGTGGYDATNHAGVDGATTVAHGDRLIFQTVNVSIEKEAYDATEIGGVSTVGDDDTTQVNVGDPIMWSLHPSVNSVNDLAVAQDVQIVDVLPEYVAYTPSCTPALPAGLTGPVIQPDTPNAGETTLTWSYDNDLLANQPLDPISVCTTTDAYAPANPTLDVVNDVTISASNVAFAERPQTDERLVELVQLGRFAVKKEVDFPLDFQSQDQVWTLIWANTSDTFPFQAPDVIDVLPWVGDGTGSLSEREVFESDFDGTVELATIPASPTVTEGGGGTRVDSGQWYATCEAPATINHDPLDATNALPGIWIAVASASTADPSATCALDAVTAVRWVSTDPMAALDTARASLTLSAQNNSANDIYVNRFVGYTASFDEAVRSNEPYVQVIGFSIGDLIWLDVDGNGVFNAGTDVTAPAGVTVSLFDSTGAAASGVDGLTSKTTDADGRWLFEGVIGQQFTGTAGPYVAGEFYVEVSGLPVGWSVDGTSATFELDPNVDENEGVDHHTLFDMGAIRSSGLVELSASVEASGLITGDEPTGDNVNVLGDPLVRDDLTNLTLDLLLVPIRGDIRVVKDVVGGGPDAGWSFVLTTTDVVGCPIPTTAVSPTFMNPAVSDVNGEAEFIDLLVYNATSGELCDYNIAEMAVAGWTQTAVAPAGPYNVDEDNVLRVEFTNTRDVGNIAVTKSVTGAPAPTGWEFTLTSLVAGCDIPSTVTNPATTADGSGGTVTFTGVPTHSEDDPFNECEYQVAETAQTGWTQVTSADDLTGLTVAADETTEVDVENQSNVLQAQVVKTVTGVDSTLAWSFGFSLTTADAIAPTLTSVDALSSGTGSATSTDLVTWDNIQPGQTYVMSETAVAGYVAGSMVCTGVTDTDTADDTVTFVAPTTTDLDDSTFEISCAISNAASPVQAQVVKTVAGVDASLDWSFGFSLAPAATLTSLDAIVEGSGSTTSTDVVTWDDLIPGTQYVLTETVTAGYDVTTDLVCTGLADSDAVPNTVTFIAPLGDTSTSTFEVDCAITNTAYGSDLQVTKTVNANDTLDWSFEFTLTPDATEVAASPATGTGSSTDTVSWSGLVPGTQYVLAETSTFGFTARALVCDGVTDLDLDAENASVTFVAPIGDENDPSVTFEVLCEITNDQGPDVAVTKVAEPLVIGPNGTTTFTIVASNIGYLDATMLVLTDLLPAGLIVDSSTASVGSFDESTGDWDIGLLTTIAPATLTITTTAEPVAGVCAADNYTNSVSATAQGEIDFDVSNNSDSATVSVASIALAKRLSDDSPIDLGNGLFQVTYEFMLTNTGNEDVQSLNIIDDLTAMINNPNPNAASFSVISVVSPDMTLTPNNSAYDGSENTSLLTGGDTLAAGASGRVNVTLELTPQAYFGPFINQAIATGSSVERQEVDPVSGLTIIYPSVTLEDDSENGSTITTAPCIYASPTPLQLSTPSNPITLGWFHSQQVGAGVQFSWQTELEISNAGFFLSAQNEAGNWQQINQEMIASQGDSTKVQNYTFLADRVAGSVFRITDVSVHGKLVHHGPFVVGQEVGTRVDRKSTDWEKIKLESEKRESQRELDRQLELQRRMQDLNPQSRHSEEPGTPVLVRVAAALLGSLVAPAYAADLVNFEINEAGIYQVGHADLIANGLDLRGIDVTRIGLESDNQQVPVMIETNGAEKFTASSYIEFPAHGKYTLYSGANQYTLTIDEGQSLILENTDEVPYKGAATSYLAEAVYAPQNHYTYLSPAQDDSWYAERLLAISGAVETTVKLQLTEQANVLSQSSNSGSNLGQGVEEKPTLRVSLWGGSALPGDGLENPDHHVLISLNGDQVASEQFDGVRVRSVEQPLVSVNDGENDISVSLPRDHGYDFDIVNLDSVSLSYARRFVAIDNGSSLAFNSSWDKFRVRGLASDQITVYRIDVDNQGYQMTERGSVNVDLSSCSAEGCMVVFAGSPVDEDSQYYVATSAGKKTPSIRVAPLTGDLFAGEASALIIAHPDFIDTDSQLLEAYASDLSGIYGSADIVSTESIYAEYSGHVQDAYAISSYVQDAYAERNSRHLIIVGGDTYDYHNNLVGGAQSFVPSLYVQIAQNLNAVPSDAKYADVDDDSIPDMTVTRLPVRTVDELASLLTKRQEYLTHNYSGTAVFAADKVDSSSYSFKNDAQDVVSGYLSGWNVSEAYMDDVDVSAGTTIISDGINGGASLTSFFGHSSTDRWSMSGLFTGDDAANLTNFGKPTVIAQWGCWNTFYVSPEEDSMAHRLLVEGKQGAVVVMGASSLTKAGAEKRMAELLFTRLTQGMRIGDAVLSAKRAFAEESPYQLDILLGWAVLGPSDLIVR